MIIFLLAAASLAPANWATAPEPGAYPRGRISPAAGARVCVFPPHARCEMPVCAHISAPDTRAQTCPRQVRGDSPLALNPSRPASVPPSLPQKERRLFSLFTEPCAWPAKARIISSSEHPVIMSTYTKARTRRQLRHPASRSRSHQLDKQQGERRKETAWLHVDAPPRPVPERSFAALGAHEYTFDGQQWRRCQGSEAFADYLEEEAARRSFYRA